MQKHTFEGGPGLPLAKGVAAGGFLYLSGQVAGKGAEPDIESQTRRTLENIDQALKDCGSSRDQIVKVTIYITDMNTKPEMDRVYREFFGDSFPARTTVGVNDLGANVLIEIDVVAILADK